MIGKGRVRSLPFRVLSVVITNPGCLRRQPQQKLNPAHHSEHIHNQSCELSLEMSTSMMSAVAQLDDLGLALLICLMGEQHCIIRAPEYLMENVEFRIHSLASKVFSLEYANVRCNLHTTGDDFMAAFERRGDDAGRSGTPETKVCCSSWDYCIYRVLLYVSLSISCHIANYHR